jgi:hypothetical protein
LSHEFQANHDGRDLPEVVSVSFKPEALTAFEEWRMVLVRLAPRSRRPLLRATIATLYSLFTCIIVGYWIGMEGSPGLQPETMALMFFAVGLLVPYRLWLRKHTLIKGLRGMGPVTVELSQESVTIRAKHRVSRIDWAGVVELRSSMREIVLRYHAGDVTSIPTRIFADPEHQARFLQLASFGLAQSRHDPASQLGVRGI